MFNGANPDGNKIMEQNERGLLVATVPVPEHDHSTHIWYCKTHNYSCVVEVNGTRKEWLRSRVL